ncbi:MAG: hypothetical protein QE487_02665 [Fluviicola sp.]|nr:hypothetical protein [Fluviicola sp.]
MRQTINQMKTIGVLCFLLFGSSNAFAQPGNTIDLTNEALRTIEPAYRQAESPKILDTVFPNPTATFPLLVMSYAPELEIKPIPPATVKTVEKLPQLYNGYARIGIGSVLMPLAEVYYNNTRTRKFNYGFHGQHISSFGRIKDYAPANFDRSNFRAFGGMNEKRYDWMAEMNYNNRGLHFYGFRNENADADSISQRFNTFNLKGQFSSHKHDSLGVNWRAGFEYRHFNDKKPSIDSLADWRGRENYFSIFGGASFKWGNEIFGANADLKYNGYKYGIEDSLLTLVDSGIVHNNTIFSLRPYITTYSKNKRLKANIGVDITVSAAEKTRIYVYPNAEVKYSLFDDILIPYAALRGGMTQQSFKAITDINEFALSNQQLRNEHKAIEALVGLKGTLSKRIGFNVSASFGNVKDKALFITDTLHSAGNRFAVIYDTINVATVEGALYYQLLEKTKIDLIGRYYSYNAISNTYAWNLPQLQFILRGSYNLYDKFIFTLDMNMEGGRRALVYAKEEDVTEENNQFAKKLGFIADANLGVEYRYNKRISAFVNVNNLAAQRYKRWYNYPVQGLQVMGGVTFRF